MADFVSFHLEPVTTHSRATASSFFSFAQFEQLNSFGPVSILVFQGACSWSRSTLSVAHVSTWINDLALTWLHGKDAQWLWQWVATVIYSLVYWLTLLVDADGKCLQLCLCSCQTLSALPTMKKGCSDSWDVVPCIASLSRDSRGRNPCWMAASQAGLKLKWYFWHENTINCRVRLHPGGYILVLSLALVPSRTENFFGFLELPWKTLFSWGFFVKGAASSPLR